MTPEEQLKLVGEIFGMEDMRHYPQLNELISEFLEQVDRATAMQSDPDTVIEILGEIDDIVCHKLRPALWERMNMSDKRATTRTEKLSSEPTITKVPGRMVLREVFNTILSGNNPCVLVGDTDCELDILHSAYNTVPGLMDSVVHLVLTPEGVSVLLEESDKVLFSLSFSF